MAKHLVQRKHNNNNKKKCIFLTNCIIILIVTFLKCSGQFAGDSVVVKKTSRDITSSGRRVQFSSCHRCVIFGKMPLQPRLERTLLQTEIKRSGIRRSSLRGTCVV